MYLDGLAAAIRAHVPEGRIPEGDADELFRLYAALVRAKGSATTESDVHDAWSAWMAARDPEHPSLVAYEDLDPSVQDQDRVFAAAVRSAADEQGVSKASQTLFTDVLFPSGPPEGESSTRQALDLYKIMVNSSESLVARRQVVNTFFLTMNGVLLTASGVIIKSAGGDKLGAVGVFILAVAGVMLCAAWRSLITSFGQLNRGKFKVIHAVEK